MSKNDLLVEIAGASTQELTLEVVENKINQAEQGLEASLQDLIACSIVLENSDLNRTNALFGKVARQIAAFLLQPQLGFSIVGLEELYQEMVKEYKAEATDVRIPFGLIAGIKVAINRRKIEAIKAPSLIEVVTPFYKERERGKPYSEANPNGEESVVEKVKDLLFLLGNTDLSADLVFVNDSIGEKMESATLSENSAFIFRSELLKYLSESGLAYSLFDKNGKEVMGIEEASVLDLKMVKLLNGQIQVVFTSLEEEVSKREEERERFERRDANGKITERKGGGVLIGMEMEAGKYRDGFSAENTAKVMLDADSMIQLATFAGDAAYSILVEGAAGYLGDLKDASTITFALPAGEESAKVAEKVKRRKLFFSGFLVPTFFPQLKQKYGYKGTTQLPAKAFSGKVNFQEACLTTVQTNIDLGLLSVLINHADKTDGAIGYGAVLARDNVASSTMTMAELDSEWEKTYAPIFKSAEKLINDHTLRNKHQWLLDFIEKMNLDTYTKLFTDLEDELIAKFFAVLQGGILGDVEMNTLKDILDQA